MGLIDLILNIACLLLWINWRTVRVTTPGKSPPLSLTSTLKKADTRRGARWLSLAGVLALLGLRSPFYWNVGSAVGWTPSLELGAISLPFRSDYFWRILLFSILSFGHILCAFYAWLLLISVINRDLPSDEPIQRQVQLQLGVVERWPIPVKLLLPAAGATLAWGFVSPGLVSLGILPIPKSTIQLWEQALLLGVTSVVVWKFLLLGICLLYLMNSYVYLGSSAFWPYINSTGANLLQPLRRFPICFGKVDLSPAVGIVLVLLITRWASRWLPWLFQRLPL